MKKLTANRKQKKILWIIIVILVILGLIGGFAIKMSFYGKNGDKTMTNVEANRLISYLGISDYHYTDRIGSSFNVKSAKKLLSTANISLDQVDVKLDSMPGFLPLTKKQFEIIYANIIEELQVDRIYLSDLYIYEIDHENDKEIDGVRYEVISTSNGDFYMQKDYGMDQSNIGKVVRTYISNNEIILCLGESKKDIIIKNAYVMKVTEDQGKDVLLTYVDGRMQNLPLSKKIKVEETTKEALCDIMISNKGVQVIKNHMKDLVKTKVTSYNDGILIVEGYKDPLYLSESFNVYKINGLFQAKKSAGTLIGYKEVSLYIKDNMVEAALITEDLYAKNIRVLISNTDYSDYYHQEVRVTSDSDFTISYGKNVKECKAGDTVSFRNGSEELKSGNAKITTKIEDGKIKVLSVERQGNHPLYRGTLELSKDDKGVLMINELSVEEYLYGVVPSEMPVFYETEALKAQAICARAYAFHQMENDHYVKYGAHLDDSISSQVYNNVPESEQSNFAVDDTYGVVPCYEDEVIEAFFFSTSCGTTSNNRVVWGGNQEPYLLDMMETELNELANLSNEASFQKFINGELGTGFIEEKEPFYRWSVEFTREELEKAINTNLYARIQAMPENILALNSSLEYEKKSLASIGTLEKIEITKRGDSGIIMEMVLYGSEETILVKGQSNARMLLNPSEVSIKKQDGSTLRGWKTLPSAYYYLEQNEDGYVLRGGGFGHGVGLSQNGANNMAKMGYKARDIIEHYYTGVVLKDMYKLAEK